jgi:hypothetical protein
MSNDNNPPAVPLPGSGDSRQSDHAPTDMVRLITAGFIGGLMTPMIQPLQEFLKSHRFPSEFGPGYWLVGAALGVLGAVMVWLLKETDVKKALVLGLSLPAFFTSLGGAVQNTGAPITTAAHGASIEGRGAAGIVSFFVTSAYAQPSPSATAASPARSLKLSRAAPAFAYTVDMLDARGKVISTFDAKAAEPSPLTLPLPDSATAVRVTAGGASLTKNFNATPGQTVEVSLRGESFRRKFDVAQVFGKTPDLVPEQLSAEINVRP